MQGGMSSGKRGDILILRGEVEERTTTTTQAAARGTRLQTRPPAYQRRAGATAGAGETALPLRHQTSHPPHLISHPARAAVDTVWTKPSPSIPATDGQRRPWCCATACSPPIQTFCAVFAFALWRPRNAFAPAPFRIPLGSLGQHLPPCCTLLEPRRASVRYFSHLFSSPGIHGASTWLIPAASRLSKWKIAQSWPIKGAASELSAGNGGEGRWD